LVRYHLYHYSHSIVTSVEIDPVVVQIAKEYFYLNSGTYLLIVLIVEDWDKRHTITIGNGVDFLKNTDQKFHVIWVDAW
jgi:spermidine synthase